MFFEEVKAALAHPCAPRHWAIHGRHAPKGAMTRKSIPAARPEQIGALASCGRDASVGVECQARVFEVLDAKAADHVEGAVFGID